jgi:hypothetical protein
MLARQDNSDPDNNADHKSDDETKAGRVAKGALAQVEDAWRFVFVHNGESAEEMARARRESIRATPRFSQKTDGAASFQIDIGRGPQPASAGQTDKVPLLI